MCVCSETLYLADWPHRSGLPFQPQLNLLSYRCLISIPRGPPHSQSSEIDFSCKIYAAAGEPAHKPHSSAGLALFGLYRWTNLKVWIICCLDNLWNARVKAEETSANKSFVSSKGLKCNLVLTDWRRLTTTDYHLGSASITYSVWGLMKTCLKANAAGGGCKETLWLQIRVCASVSSLQRRSGAGTLAKKSKATESPRAERKIRFTGVTAQAWPSSKCLFFFLPVETS